MVTPLTGYNIIKEGDLYNVDGFYNGQGLELFSEESIAGLYDNDISTPVVSIIGDTISGSVTAIEAHWGETYDVSSVKYYHNLTTNSGISISYGIDSYDENVAVLSTVAGLTSALGLGDARYIRIIHSISPDIVLESKQVVVEGYKNDKIGFGLDSLSDIEQLYLNNSPVGTMSSDPLSINVYNEYEVPMDIKLSVAPTGNPADDYVFVSTTYSGEYFGINDHGPAVPASEAITLHSNSLVTTDIGTIENEWFIVHSGIIQSCVSPTSEGLRIAHSTPGGNMAYTIGNLPFGIVSRDSFTGDQSFTIKLKVKFTKSFNGWVDGHVLGLFGFSNNIPAPSSSFLYKWPYKDEGATGRAGNSGAHIGFFSGQNPYLVESWYQMWVGDGSLRDEYYGALTGSTYSFDYFGENVDNAVGGNKDGTTEARFRTWVLTWDHVDRTVCGYIDGLKIASYRFTKPPIEGCHFYFILTSSGMTSGTVVIKDFEIDIQRIYRQRLLDYGGYLSASASSCDTDFHGPEKLVDGTDTEWISGSPVLPNDYIDISLDIPRDIIGFSITNPYIYPEHWGVPDYAIVTGVSGTTSKNISYSLDTISVQVDSNTPIFCEIDSTWQNSEGVSQYRFVGADGYATTCSGSSDVRITFLSFNGYSRSGYLDSVAIREVSLLEEYYDDVQIFPPDTGPDKVPWNRGRFCNTEISGPSLPCSIVSNTVYEVAGAGNCLQLMPDVDYGISNSYVRYSGHGSYEFNLTGLIFDHGTENRQVHFTTPVSLWRRFKVKVPVIAVHFECAVNPDGHVLPAYIDSFKLQYLRASGDPNVEEDWVNIPPIKNPYTGLSSEYATYRQFFIDNNDGEYYTNTSMSFNGCPGMPANAWLVPSDVAAKKDFRWSGSWYVASSNSGLYYLELDYPVETDSVRMVIRRCVDYQRTLETANGNLLQLSIFSSICAGSYTSPVFDTGTCLNTERVFAELSSVATSSGVVLIRSNDSPPEYKDEVEYLNWQPWQVPFKDTIYDAETGTDINKGDIAVGHFRAWPKVGVVRGSRVYIMPTSKDYSPVYYDFIVGVWGLLPVMGNPGDNIRASNTIYNHAVILDDGIMYVATEMGDSNSHRMMRYDFESDDYGISGWRHLDVLRPPEAEVGGMVGYGSLIYFVGRYGDVVKFDPSSGSWDPSLSKMPMHGLSSRYYFWPVIKGNKIYIFGGQTPGGAPVTYIDVYDIDRDVWDTVDYFPYLVGDEVVAHLYGDDILILPANNNQVGMAALFDTTTNSVSIPVLPELQGRYFHINALDSYMNRPSSWPVGLSWVYDGWVYGYAYNYDPPTNGFGRLKLKKEQWTSGHFPNRYDDTWGTSTSIPWESLDTQAEVMSQNRYFQFKIQLNCSPDGVSSHVVSATVVTPQVIPDVPSLGSGQFYVKLGISTNDVFEGWYSGAKPWDHGHSWGMYYVKSSDGYSIDRSCLVLDTVDSGSYRSSYQFPVVIKESPSSYKLWVGQGRMGAVPIPEGSPYSTLSSGSIYYATSVDGYSWTAPEQILPLGAHGIYDTYSIDDCCVVEVSPSDYRMWYTGIQLSSGTKRIIYCISDDGASWSGFRLGHDIYTGGLPDQVDIYGVFGPCVLYGDSQFTMWYCGTGLSEQTCIIRCVSNDGYTWSEHQVVIPVAFSGVWDRYSTSYPAVIKDVDTYKMWYIGLDDERNRRILYCYSSDGIHWSEPFLTMSQGLGISDVSGIGRLWVVNNKVLEVPNTYFDSAQIKIYN